MTPVKFASYEWLDVTLEATAREHTPFPGYVSNHSAVSAACAKHSRGKFCR